MRKDAIALLILLSITASRLIVSPAYASDTANASQKPKEDSWKTMAPMPTPREYFGTAVVDGKIYTIGGYDGKITNVTEVYDPATNQWTTKASMPTPRYQFAAAVYQGKIYCMGGIGVNWRFTNVTEVYDPATETWETKAAMPTAKSEADACVVNGTIYVVGGKRDQSGLSILDLLNGKFYEAPTEVYDPAADNWTTGPPVQYTEVVSLGIKSITYDHASQGKTAMIGNQLYWVGVVSSSTSWKSGIATLVFNPENGGWTPRASPPYRPYYIDVQGAVGITGTWAPKAIYLFGSNRVTMYDPASNTWTKAADHPMQQGFGVAVVNDKIYMMGGFRIENVVDDKRVPGFREVISGANEEYTPLGYGSIPPAVNVVSPQNGTVITDSLALNFSVNRSDVTVTYSLDGAEERATAAGNLTVNGLSRGSHTLTVYSVDSFGNEGTPETISFTAQGSPAITLVIAVVVAIAVGIVGVTVYLKKSKQRTSAHPA